MAACCTQGPEVPSSKILIHLSFKRLLIAWGWVLDTLGEFHCFVPLTPFFKHPGSLPLWEEIFLAGPFLSVLCHLSQGSLLRGSLLPCWEQVVKTNGYWQGQVGAALLVCPQSCVCSCYLQRNTRRPCLGVFFALKRKKDRYDPKLLVNPYNPATYPLPCLCSCSLHLSWSWVLRLLPEYRVQRKYIHENCGQYN